MILFTGHYKIGF